MSINNLAKHHNNRLTGNNSIAAMCLRSLAHGGLDNECERVITNSDHRSREWFDLDGNKLTDDQFLNLIGENLKKAKKLFDNYGGNCTAIINRKNKGSIPSRAVRRGTQYYDRNGTHTAQAIIAKREKVAAKTLKRFFEKPLSHKEIYKLIDAYKETRRCRK